MTEQDKARAKAEELRGEEEITSGENLPLENEDSDQRALVQAQAKHIKELYGKDYANAGTEEVTMEDLNTPWLILMQSNTDIEGRIPGQYYRSDTKEMMPAVDVNFVYFTNKVKHNDKKNIDEPYKEYYGFFATTNEPFRMKMKGWGLPAHRELQTEISVYKKKLNVPMFALTVRLTSERKEGITKTNEPYKIDKIVCTILKEGSLPKIEDDPERVGFLLEAVSRFKNIAPKDEEEIIPAQEKQEDDYIPPEEQ
jgi:hypothetical protein